VKFELELKLCDFGTVVDSMGLERYYLSSVQCYSLPSYTHIRDGLYPFKLFFMILYSFISFFNCVDVGNDYLCIYSSS
jgi:hypothetical protein